MNNFGFSPSIGEKLDTQKFEVSNHPDIGSWTVKIASISKYPNVSIGILI